MVDSNLLILLIVGLTEPALIGRHKVLKRYDQDSFQLLLLHLQNYSALISTPNILTETSNLASQIDATAKRAIRVTVSDFVAKNLEIAVRSVAAARHPEFLRLGLTDAAILSILDRDTLLLTDDLDLWSAAQSHGLHAKNFSHLREDFFGEF